MNILMMPLLLAIATMTQADTVRELGRVRVTDDIIYHDSYLLRNRPGVAIDGYFRTYGEPPWRVEYDATFVTPDGSYSISDDADVLWFGAGGAEYRVWSRYNDTEYSIVFIRRAPDEQIVSVDGVDYIVPNYDRATIIRIEHNEVVWDLDYRGIN